MTDRRKPAKRVILSAAKDLGFERTFGIEILRYAQDDNAG